MDIYNYSVRSAMGAYLQTCHSLGIPPGIFPNTTLNQKLNILPNATYNPGEFPITRYITIGRGAQQAVLGQNGDDDIVSVPHEPKHTGPYLGIPLVLRPVNSDLSSIQQQSYFLKTLINVGGVDYIAYYAKELDFSNVTVTLERINGLTGEASPFNFLLSDLNPTPPNLVNAGQNLANPDSISASAKVPFNLTTFDLDELRNVHQILYGTGSKVSFSEIIPLAAVKRSTTRNFGNGIETYQELVGAVAVNYYSEYNKIEVSTTSKEKILDIGCAEPLQFPTS